MNYIVSKYSVQEYARVWMATLDAFTLSWIKWEINQIELYCTREFIHGHLYWIHTIMKLYGSIMFKSVHGHFNYSQNLMNSMRNELDWKNSGQRYSIFMATLRAIQLPHRWIIQLTTMISKKTQRWLQVQYLDLADSQ